MPQLDRMTDKQAGYMELEGAKKEGDCRKVAVQGGVSFQLGCCNEFEPESKTVKQFKCGNCEYRKGGAAAGLVSAMKRSGFGSRLGR